jgi:hypothetical protein
MRGKKSSGPDLMLGSQPIVETPAAKKPAAKKPAAKKPAAKKLAAKKLAAKKPAEKKTKIQAYKPTKAHKPARDKPAELNKDILNIAKKSLPLISAYMMLGKYKLPPVMKMKA